MDSSKTRVLTEQVRRLRARFAQSVDTLLGEVIPAELLKQWVLEEAVQWRERLYGPLTINYRGLPLLSCSLLSSGLAESPSIGRRPTDTPSMLRRSQQAGLTGSASRR